MEALLVVADLGAVGALLAVPGRRERAQAWLGRGAILGAVVLAHEVLYAMDGRVVGQVAPAGAGRASRAQGVGAQGCAELGGVVRGRGVATRRGAPELRVALEDLARGGGCRERKGRDITMGACPRTPRLGRQAPPTLHVCPRAVNPPTLLSQEVAKCGICPSPPSTFFSAACHDPKRPGTLQGLAVAPATAASLWTARLSISGLLYWGRGGIC